MTDEQKRDLSHIDELIDRIEHGDGLLIRDTDDIRLVRKSLLTYEAVVNLAERYEYGKSRKDLSRV